MIELDTKVCSKCLKCKDTEEFRFLASQGRYLSHCKVCEREYAQHRAQGRTPEQRAVIKQQARKRYAIRAIGHYIDKYGEAICEEAKVLKKQNHPR